jgi:hypothetical protein
VHLHAVFLEHSLEEAPDLLAEERLEGHVLHHHDLAVHAVRRGERGRDLAADVAPADQHRPLAGLGVRPDRVRVAERPEIVDALQVAAVDA